MKQLICIAAACFFYGVGHSQSYANVSGKQDTSYNNYTAWVSTKKTHPDIRLVEPAVFSGISEKKSITYCRYGKRKMLLDVFYPKAINERKRTAVMIIHGGGWRSGNRTQHYAMAQQLALKGYVCFTPEYRLSTEALFPAAVYDLKAAIRWIRDHAAKYNIDTAKIAVAGFSAGGELAAFLGVTSGMPLFEGTAERPKQSSAVNAVIDIDGTLSFVHPESGEGDDSRRTSAGTAWFGYSKKENTVLWEIASPLSFAGNNKAPFLFINSSLARMHAGRTDFIKILTANHIYTEIKEFENSPHSFCLFEPWFTPTIQTMDAYLKKIFN